MLLTTRKDAAKKACGAVLLCAVPVMSFCSSTQRTSIGGVGSVLLTISAVAKVQRILRHFVTEALARELQHESKLT